jgi:CubicO group peptidase (beta-lactamase class C family)/D-alanyl-D-alanine dipeptidase
MPRLLYLPQASAFVLLLLAALSARAADNVPPAVGYEEITRRLADLIEHERVDKGLPALSIALVDGDRIVWAQGFGFADPKNRVPATAETVYRVGSVSKLFTDLAVMQLVERGKLELDTPLTRVLPDFKPEDPFNKPITLRQLMTHRSGLVREPPAGNYFDADERSLAKTVQSLNRTRLVYAPESRVKYSNAAVATAGFVLETTQRQPFARYLSRSLLEPMGMKRSAFEPDPVLTKGMAQAVMWTYHGRDFAAPTFEMGMAPAASMVSTVTDLGQFLTILFAGGKGPGGQIITAATLEQMWTPQFAKPGEKAGFGLGFQVSELEGRRRVGHGGAVYGYATEVAALPADRLGVVVITSRDCCNAVTTRVADDALRLLLARKLNKPLPALERTTPLDPARARRLAGRYRAGDKVLDLEESAGKLFVTPARGGFRVELRALGDDLMVDDRLAWGQRVGLDGERLKIGDEVYERVAVPRPAPAPGKWLGLIGEYGWDHNVLVIAEKDGKLHALIEWFFLYPLEEESPDVYRFPDFGLYHGEKLVFSRDAAGKATRVEAAGIAFPRRHLDGEDGQTFRIKPVRPIEDIRKAALAARPPEQRGEFNQPDLVELTTLDPEIKLDIRYASTNNFLSTPFYTSAKAFLQRPAAEALVRINRELKKEGYGLLIHDGYRPWAVTRMFWDATPENLHIFVADPADGSRHNRGCAVDLTLYDRATGKAIDMVGGYDEMSDRSYPDYFGGTSLQRWHRARLRRAMEADGFTVYEAEWWHFDYRDWKKYPVANLTFEQIKEQPKK